MSKTTREQLEAELVALRSQNAAQAGEIERLTLMITELEQRRDKGSTNSSCSTVVDPGWRPASTSACLTQARRDSLPTPSWRATLEITPWSPGSACRTSPTMRTARSFSSGGYRFDDVCFLSMTPPNSVQARASGDPRPVQHGPQARRRRTRSPRHVVPRRGVDATDNDLSHRGRRTTPQSAPSTSSHRAELRPDRQPAGITSVRRPTCTPASVGAKNPRSVGDVNVYLRSV
jgi:hypothetical protein